jgi:hypothetical protein
LPVKEDRQRLSLGRTRDFPTHAQSGLGTGFRQATEPAGAASPAEMEGLIVPRAFALLVRFAPVLALCALFNAGCGGDHSTSTDGTDPPEPAGWFGITFEQPPHYRFRADSRDSINILISRARVGSTPYHGKVMFSLDQPLPAGIVSRFDPDSTEGDVAVLRLEIPGTIADTTVVLRINATPADTAVASCRLDGNLRIVGAGRPYVASLDPDSGGAGDAVHVSLHGLWFDSPATVQVLPSGVEVDSVEVVSPELIHARFLVSPDSPRGIKTVQVSNPGGPARERPAFEVMSRPPKLFSIEPDSGFAGSTVHVRLLGESFTEPAHVDVASSGVITVPPESVRVVSPIEITAVFQIIPGANRARYFPMVETLDGTTADMVGFWVMPTNLHVPVLTDISPAGGAPGTNVHVTLTGAWFRYWIRVEESMGTGVAIDSVDVVSDSLATAVFHVSPSASLDGHWISVTTEGGRSGVFVWMVEDPPTLTGVYRMDGYAYLGFARNSSYPIRLTGSSFIDPQILVSGTGVTFEASGTGVELNGVCAIELSSELGPRDVQVRSEFGVSNVVAITVTPGPPVLWGIDPSSGHQGETVDTVVNGQDLVTGTSFAADGLTLVGATRVSDDRWNLRLSLPASGALGPHQVTARTIAGTSNPAVFTVLE